jgi:UDP-N-acetylmuramoylalanine--D-glutamate ligase
MQKFMFPLYSPLSMATVHVLGLGRSGIAAARLLKREGWDVSASDASTSEALLERKALLEAEDIPVVLNTRFSLDALNTAGFPKPDQLVVSPGIAWQLPALEAARRAGVETIGELELAWRYLKQVPWVGITGTNGKTTVTALTAAIFQAAGLKAPACGNIGLSACEIALSGESVDWIVAEISSYQIESSPTLAPQIGAWTTLTPDHLERHGTLENYSQIKAALLQRAHYRVLNGDDPYLQEHLDQRWSDLWWTSVQGQQFGDPVRAAQVYLEDGWVCVQGDGRLSVGQDRIVPADALPMPGAHNQQNLLVAVAVACLAGIEKAAIAAAVASFPGVPHRLERICTWQGIEFINDSKATNYDAAQVGLESVEAPVILIAGGDPKVGEDQLWIQSIQAKVAFVLLIGKAAPTFAQRLQASGFHHYESVDTMEKAVPRAAELAQEWGAKGVLLSPACASFDQYQSFEHRGDHFRSLCQNLVQGL